ncbi:MAG: GNAT family N-acetyltransferase, partial [Candidatus Binatia bacterium]
EQPIAYHLGFELNGKFIFYKPTFDVNLWAEWPGEVLIRHLFDYAASRGIREFDFTAGDEAYKYRFANQVRRNYTLHLYPPGPRGLTLCVCKTVEERAKARLRQNPSILQAIKAGISVSKRIGRSSRSALQVGTLRRLGSDVITRAFRRAVFARDDLLVFSCVTEVRAAADENLKIWSSTLAELASLSLQHSDFLDVRRLHIARDRLKQGDVAYVAKDGVGPLHVVWIGTRNEVAASEVDSEWRLELDDSVSLVYDYWTLPAIRGREISASVLRKLVNLAPERHRQLWISCAGDDFAARDAIEKAGFRLRYRMGRVQLLYWFSRTWVQ